MKRLLLILLVSPLFAAAQVVYPSLNINLLGQWSDPTMTLAHSYNLKYNSVWGYAQNGKEYAILGSAEGTHFIEVTNPGTPVERDFVQGRRMATVWREYKTYGKYLYAVSDDAPPNSLQIIDMSYLPDSVHVVYDSNTLIEQSHTVFIEGDKMYLGAAKKSGVYYSMAVYSLANPELPVFLRSLNQDYPSINHVHDMFVRNDTIYASAGYDGLHIYALTSQNQFVEIGSLTSYPGAGYNHSSALTENGRTLIFADEVGPKLPVKSIDVSDLTNITVLDTFRSGPIGTPHNPFIKGNTHTVIAYYKDGVQIFDISNPANCFRTGFFDTDPLDNGSGSEYQGCWGAYIDLPSGNILASDMQNGLFVLDATVALTIKPSTAPVPTPVAFPVPFADELNIDFEGKSTDNVAYVLYNISGQKVYENTRQIQRGFNRISIETKSLPAGMYILQMNDGKNDHLRKVIKQ